MFSKLRKKEKPMPSAGPVLSPQASTQSWIPIKDVYNGVIHRKDGAMISAIRVQPVNFNLLGENEKLRKIKALEEVLNGIDLPFQIISIARPVDLDAYIASLDAMRSHTTSRIKARLLTGYMRQAASMATSGEALERHFYILIDQRVEKNAQQEELLLMKKASDLASRLTTADLAAHVCNDEELRNLLFIFTNPIQAAYERAPQTPFLLPSLFEQGEWLHAEVSGTE